MSIMVWQAIRLEIPSRWSPVKLEGDFDQGYVLLADLQRPRLGLRWYTPSKRRLDSAKRVRLALLDEIGKLAADEAAAFDLGPAWENAMLYTEPEPPGRDVWVGYHRASGRVVQVIYHAHRRERILRDTILPTLQDLGDQSLLPWSVFDLSCRISKDLPLVSQQLNAGDLSLTFTAKTHTIVVHQIAVAELALKRRPLEKWLLIEQRACKKHFRPAGQPSEITISVEGRELHGFSATMRRRRRFFFAWKIARRMFTLALHDPVRDRLVIVQGDDIDTVNSTTQSIGWAVQPVASD